MGWSVSQFALLMPLFGTLGVISVWSPVPSFGNKRDIFQQVVHVGSASIKHHSNNRRWK